MPVKKNPTPGEITVMAGGGVAFIFSFLAFYKTDGVTIAGNSIGGSSISAWSSGLFPAATLMVIFALIAAIAVAVNRFTSADLPHLPFGFTWEQLYLVLGFVAAIYALAYLVQSKGGVSFGIGFWFVFLGCIASFVGAVLIQREHSHSAPPPSA